MPISDLRGSVVESVGRVQTSVTPELLARIVELYEAGATASAVGQEVGLSRFAVMSRLRQAGARLRRQGLDSEAVERARELYASGRTLKRVGVELGVAQATVRKYLLEADVVLRPPLIPKAK